MANLYVWVDERQREALTQRIRRLHLNAGYFRGLPVDVDPVEYLIHALFPDGQPCRFHAANISLAAGESGRTKLALRPAIDTAGDPRFPRGASLALSGSWERHVPQPIFIISGIAEISDCATRDFERLLDVFVYHHDPQDRLRRDDNVLVSDDVLALPLISRITQERLKDWDEFVRWKRKLVQASAVGLRFVSRDWLDDTHLAFQVVAPDPAVLQQAQRALARDELRAFALEASQDPLTFRPQDTPRRPRLRESTLGKGEASLAGPAVPWLGEDAQAGWFAARWVVAPDEDSLNEIDAAENPGAVRASLLAKIPQQGFLSVSMAGDLSLLKRHEQAIQKLKEQGGNSPYLSAYLFDVKQARSPTTTAPVLNWQQPSLNEPQRQAVQKMLSAPDLCLLQGPPGTGKTTVIAEAMLQMVARGETVLLASQAHTAVDNALGRLGQSTSVRAIRLGREDKVTDEGRAFYGSRSLQRYYEALAAHGTRQLEAWSTEAEARDALAAWCDRAGFALADVQAEQAKLQVQHDGMRAIERARDQAWQALQRLAQQREDDASRRRSLVRLQQALVSPGDSDLLGPLPVVISREVNALAVSILALGAKGVRLRATAAEWGDRPEHQAAVLALLLDDLQHVRWASQRLRTDAARLRERPEGLHQDPAIRLQIERLKRQVDAALASMDAEPDDVRHQQTWRVARAEVRQLELAQGVLWDEAACAQLFVDTVPWRQTSPDVGALVDRMLAALDAIDDELATVQQTQRRLLTRIDEVLAADCVAPAVDESSWRAAQADLDRGQATVARVEAALAQLTKQAGATLKAYPSPEEQAAGARGEPASAFDNPEECARALQQALQTAKAALNAAQALGDAQQVHRELWSPLLADWVRDLRGNEAAEADWKHLRADWPSMCNVVAITCNERDSTLDDAGQAHFDVVIIDEVSKATPLELLLPLMRARRAVLVGDHRQLPPLFQESLDAVTVQDVADEARQADPGGATATALSKENLERFERMVTASLFKEHFEGADEAIRGRLSVQFRMHPQIMSLVNRFYEGTLSCGLSQPDKERAHPFVLPDVSGNPMLKAEDHVLWIDTSRGLDGQVCSEDLDQQGRPLRTNRLEARLIAHLMQQLDRQAVAAGHSPQRRMSVGVVSFYAAQLRMIRSELERVKPKGGWQALEVDVNTVIRYQGREKDVVLVSLVRNDGRMDEPGATRRRRSSRANVARYEFINVALSRARKLLIALGARSMFESYEVDLPNMDQPGCTRRPVYRDMFQQLEREARLFEARKVLAPERPSTLVPSRPSSRPGRAGGAR